MARTKTKVVKRTSKYLFHYDIERWANGFKLFIIEKYLSYCLGDSKEERKLKKELTKDKYMPIWIANVTDETYNRNIGKNYEIELNPEKAFGLRNASLIQRMPVKVFQEQKLNPVPGISFNFDGRMGKVLVVSGGRVMVDFNHPLSGKNVIYDIKVLEKVDDLNEKIKSLNEFFFRSDPKFTVKEENLSVVLLKGMKKFAEMFKGKYKEILGLNLEIIEEGLNEKEKKTETENNLSKKGP